MKSLLKHTAIHLLAIIAAYGVVALFFEVLLPLIPKGGGLTIILAYFFLPLIAGAIATVIWYRLGRPSYQRLVLYNIVLALPATVYILCDTSIYSIDRYIIFILLLFWTFLSFFGSCLSKRTIDIEVGIRRRRNRPASPPE